MAKEFTTVFKPEEIVERIIPTKIRIKGTNHEYTETIKNKEHYADLLYRARLTVELHNRDAAGPEEMWEIREERIKPVEAPS